MRLYSLNGKFCASVCFFFIDWNLLLDCFLIRRLFFLSVLLVFLKELRVEVVGPGIGRDADQDRVLDQHDP